VSDQSHSVRFVPQLESFGSGNHIASFRTSRQKVAILLAALNRDTAVNLLRKFDPGSIKQLLESSGQLGDLNTGDFEPVVREFTAEFAEALGISAGAEQLMPLLEAAFTSETVSELLGLSAKEVKDSVWPKFTPKMDAILVPFLLDEHEQTAAIILSKLPVDLAVKCFALLPQELTPRLLARSLSQRPIAAEILSLLEQSLEEQFFSKTEEASKDVWIERVASMVNRMEREQAMSVLASLEKTSPEQARQLRKHIFMFEDLDRMEAKSKSRLFDRVAAELVTPALWGMDAAFKEGILSCLSARARRMVESELGAGDQEPRKDTLPARKKIAEVALIMSRKGEISLPDDSGIVQTANAVAA
jgi:flagellar motor switch protein FliG